MLAKAETLAAQQAQRQIHDASRQAGLSLGAEIERLVDLARSNDHVTPAEIDTLVHTRNEITTLLSQSRLRLDAIRLLWRAPA
jgi:ATP-dependent helicase HepA